MSCVNCGHGKEMHDSDCDERMEKEWCNGDSCECVHYFDEEAAQAKQALRIAELEEENENLKEIVGAVSCANTAKSPIP